MGVAQQSDVNLRLIPVPFRSSGEKKLGNPAASFPANGAKRAKPNVVFRPRSGKRILVQSAPLNKLTSGRAKLSLLSG